MTALEIGLALMYIPAILLWIASKLKLFTNDSVFKQINVARKQKIVNKGNIHTQNNYAEHQTIVQNNTINNTLAATDTKQLTKEEILEKARREAPLTSAMLARMTPTHYQGLDNYLGLSETSKTVENDVFSSSDNLSITRQVMPASSVLKPNDVIISSVIRKKVLDKYDEVIKWKHETPSYIARKVFGITGGGSRLQYIAAITQVLETEATNNELEGE